MMIDIDKKSDTPLYLQLRNRIRDMIVSGILKPNFKLTPTR